jgi:hypothetical protein
MSPLPSRSISVVLLAAVVGTFGCNDDSSPMDLDPGTGSLECEILSYPCSMAEVDLPILLRSNELGDSALAMLEAGASTADAAAWLTAQEGMADVMSGGLGVWFRLEGGRGTWVVTEGAVLTDPGPSAAAMPLAAPLDRAARRLPGAETSRPGRPPADPPARISADGRSETSLSARASLPEHLASEWGATPPAPTRANLDPPRPGLDIVGSGSEEKKALILSSILWETGQWDAGVAVRDILLSTRGYENGVDFVANTDSTATDVGLSSFTGWGAYDVVHVMSHGLRVCDDDGCRGVLTVNRLSAFFPADLSDAQQVERLKEVNQPGVELVKSGGAGYVAVNADFFRSHAGDLVDTVIFLNACQLFGNGATDLVDALAGTSNIVFGWSEAVYVGDALNATRRLFKELSEGGYPAEVAYERVGDLRTGRPTDYGPSPMLRMARRPSGGDLQIREVVTLLHPGSGQRLTGDDRVQIEGIPGDGEEDSAPFLVQVDGVLPEHADETVLHVSVDDVESDPVPVSSGTPNDKDQWIIEGEIPLGYDLEEDRPADFLARVELTSEGESEHRSGAILTGATWTLASEGDMTGEVTLHGSTALGAETWTAEADFAVDGEGRVFGDGMGFLSGTELVFSYDDEELYCLVAAPVELGYLFDLTGRVDGGVLSLEAENVRAAEFSSETCEGVSEATIEASLLAFLSATLETSVPFQHEAVQEREVPASGPLAHDGVVVGSYETLYRWVNTIRKEGCPVGAEDPAC